MSASPDPAALLQLAQDLAMEAGALLRRRALEPRTAIGTKSTLTDMVTEVDRESEALIVNRIRLLRPHDSILAEEGASRAGSSGVRWVIDPLDGTTNFLYGYYLFAVSIGVEFEGEVIAGVVHDAAHNETFSASMGGGAFRDGQRIHVTAQAEIGHALIGTGFGYDRERRRVQGALLARVLPQIRDIRRGGAAALELCAVACGRLDGYYELGLQQWDYAAGGLIVREAGGIAVQLPDGMVIAGGPVVHAALRKLVSRRLRARTGDS
jgi:myo-inositol-1(or 4)-monophosphatase